MIGRMQRRTKIITGAAVVAVVAGAGGTGIALAGVGRDDEAPIRGTTLERASAAALDHTGEGRVTATEVGDEESLYEVEVTLDDGAQVDVQLDERFRVVGDEEDRSEAEDGNEDQ
jgi:hypothetical protein